MARVPQGITASCADRPDDVNLAHSASRPHSAN